MHITGGHALRGKISISGAKNAALPLMIASLLTDEEITLHNIPHLTDVATLKKLLAHHGASLSTTQTTPTVLHCRAANIASTQAPYGLVSRMRASFWVLGPLLARCGKARVSLPGGCAIGVRSVEQYLKGLAAMGASIDLVDGYVEASCAGRLHGAKITFPFVSVGATHVLMMAATLARGETVLENVAREPEVANLGACLVAMGAKIEGLGTSRLVVHGVDRLGGTSHHIMADRIEAGTYAVAAAITGGDILLQGIEQSLLTAPLEILRQAGVDIETSSKGIRVSLKDKKALRAVNFSTAPYPDFPTDLQAQFMSLMVLARGTSVIEEKIFDNRFMHVQELVRLGADISVNTSFATVRGVQTLKAAPLTATDLRASVSLILAGLAAVGTTRLRRLYHLDRGFERLEEKLRGCGATLTRVSPRSS